VAVNVLIRFAPAEDRSDLTGYLYPSAIVSLVGVQADELIRKDATEGEKGIFERMRAPLRH